MARLLHIKCVLPSDYYSIRTFHIRTSSGQKYGIKQFQTLLIDAEGEDWISFRLGLRRCKLDLAPVAHQEEAFVFITIRAATEMFDVLLDCLRFRNFLRVRLVDENTFLEADRVYGQLPPALEYRFTEYLLVALTAIPFLGYLVYPVLRPDFLDGSFVFFIGFMGMAGCLRLLVCRKSTTRSNFNMTIRLSVVISLVILAYSDFPPAMTSWFLVLAMLTYMLSLANHGKEVKCQYQE